MYIDIEYKFAWIWRFLITWGYEISIGFYDTDMEHTLWEISIPKD